MGNSIDVRDFGACGDGAFDNYGAFQRAINAAIGSGAEIVVPSGQFLISTAGIVPAIWDFRTRTFLAVPDATVRIRGAGQDSTSIVAGQQFGSGGIIGYGRSGLNPQVARVDISDLTLDGNYSGAGGSIAQPSSGPGALVSLPWPGTSASSPSRTGRYHTFTRVRFYRPTGYGFQPTQGAKIVACEFDHMGQPDQYVLNYDNLGSGPGDAVVTACTWHDSTGNYADFISSSAAFIRLVMTACTSYNHHNGGIYACGQQSVITGNSLANNVSGSGVGYDASTGSVNKSRNVVAGNCLVNINLGSSGLSNSLYGDLFSGLNSSDG